MNKLIKGYEDAPAGWRLFWQTSMLPLTPLLISILAILLIIEVTLLIISIPQGILWMVADGPDEEEKIMRYSPYGTFNELIGVRKRREIYRR